MRDTVIEMLAIFWLGLAVAVSCYDAGIARACGGEQRITFWKALVWPVVLAASAFDGKTHQPIDDSDICDPYRQKSV